MKRKEIIIKFAHNLAEWQRDHVVWSFLLLRASSVWVPMIYTFFGVQLKLVKMDAQTLRFTVFGFIVIFLVFIVDVIGNVSLNYDNKNNTVEELKEQLANQVENNLVISNLRKGSHNVCDSKLSTLIDQVSFYCSNSQKKPPAIISNPHKQLNVLAKELSGSLASLLKFGKQTDIEELFTSIAYRFPQEQDNEWHWATLERGMSITDLQCEIDGKKSAFMTLLEKKGHILFKNSKQVAYERNEYIPDDEDEYDERGKLKGSIVCFQSSIKKNDKKLIEFVINISSYSQQFVQGLSDGHDIVQTAKYNVDKVLLPNYIVRIKNELCLLYLEYLHDTRIIGR